MVRPKAAEILGSDPVLQGYDFDERQAVRVIASEQTDPPRRRERFLAAIRSSFEPDVYSKPLWRVLMRYRVSLLNSGNDPALVREVWCQATRRRPGLLASLVEALINQRRSRLIH